MFSSAYRASVGPLLLLIPGVVLFGSGKVLSADLAGRGRPGVTTAASVLGLIIMVALDLLLIPTRGVSGAAAASSLAYAIVFAFQVLVFTRLTGEKVRSTVIPERSDIAFVRRGLARLRDERPGLSASQAAEPR